MSEYGISYSDANALGWYFVTGQCRFQRSTHGIMVEKLERESSGSTKCRVCGGKGILMEPSAVSRHKRRGKATEKRERWKLVEDHGIWEDTRVNEWAPVVIGSWCQFCSGSGVVPKKNTRRKCQVCGGKKKDRCGCSNCLGVGSEPDEVLVPGNAGVYIGYEVDGDTLRRFAVISRRLSTLPTTHRRTLELFYGPTGERWGRTSSYAGRLAAIQPLTKDGKELLRRTKTDGDVEVDATPAERVHSQWVLNAGKNKPWRYDLLDGSRRQAEDRMRAAAKAWNNDGELPDWKERYGALCGQIDATAEKVEAWLEEFHEEPRLPIKREDGVWR